MYEEEEMVRKGRINAEEARIREEEIHRRRAA